MMKTGGLIFFLLFSFELFAQPDLTGNWSGEGVKNGKPMSFDLTFNDDDQFKLVYQSNPAGLEIKGMWKFVGNRLSFKNSDGSLALRQVTKRPKGHRGLLIAFHKPNGSFLFIGASGNFSLLGWEKREKSVSLNFEE